MDKLLHNKPYLKSTQNSFKHLQNLKRKKANQRENQPHPTTPSYVFFTNQKKFLLGQRNLGQLSHSTQKWRILATEGINNIFPQACKKNTVLDRKQEKKNKYPHKECTWSIKIQWVKLRPEVVNFTKLPHKEFIFLLQDFTQHNTIKWLFNYSKLFFRYVKLNFTAEKHLGISF